MTTRLPKRNAPGDQTEGAPAKNTTATAPSLPANTNRRYWARQLIDRGFARGDVPRYGSAPWSALPEGDPRKVAAVVIAAEAWARQGDDMADNLHREIAARRREAKQLMDGEYVATHRAHREQWGHLRAVRPVYDNGTPRDLYDIGADYRSGGAA